MVSNHIEAEQCDRRMATLRSEIVAGLKSLQLDPLRPINRGYTSPNAQRVLEPGPFTRMQQLQLRAQLCVAISKLWEFIEPFTHIPKEPVTIFWRTVQTARCALHFIGQRCISEFAVLWMF